MPSFHCNLCHGFKRNAYLLMQESDLMILEENLKPTWPHLVEPLEMIVDQLAVAWGVVSHLKAVKDSSELRAAIEIVQVFPYI